MTFVLQIRTNPEKTSPRKLVPIGDRTRARCVTGAHATARSSAVDMERKRWKGYIRGFVKGRGAIEIATIWSVPGHLFFSERKKNTRLYITKVSYQSGSRFYKQTSLETVLPMGTLSCTFTMAYEIHNVYK